MYKTVAWWRLFRNWFVIYLARYVPWLNLKNRMYRWLGVKVGKDVSVALSVVLDVFFPEEITIGDNTIIGYNTVILGHEFLRHEMRRGPVVIGKNVVIGSNCTILPGVVIGDGAVVSSMSLVNKDVPPGAKVGGVPIRMIGAGEEEGNEGNEGKRRDIQEWEVSIYSRLAKRM